MTENDARAVLLVRAFEADGAADPAWSAADAAAADDATRRQVGESASFETWIAARARFAVERMTARNTAAQAALHAAGWPAWLAGALVVVALVAGVATDALGGAHRINLLAPPLLALTAWNLLVYLALIVQALRPAPTRANAGALRAAIANWIARGPARAGLGDATAGPLPAFLRSWTRHAQTLYAARVALMLHAGAAALVFGALLSLYARGLVLEYRAGWDSTFLSPAGVQAVLATVLAPASALSGIALPDTARVAAMRFSTGPGENAAPWIHLYAITLAWVVIVPRLALAAVAALRARRLAMHFPLALDDAYFRRFRHGRSGQAVAVHVLPYSYHVAPAQHEALARELERHVGARVELTVSGTLPLGAEDDLTPWLGNDAAASSSTPSNRMLVVLFPLAATPEHEQHGALLRALAAHAKQSSVSHVLALVDESGFRARFRGETLALRLHERQQAWRALLHDADAEPLFVDLDTRAGAPRADARPAASA